MLNVLYILEALRHNNMPGLQFYLDKVSDDEGMGNKVNLSSFELKNFFKFVLAWLAREKRNILMSQPCLHTLTQTPLSANQSARTILVIL